jgi:phospholipase/lecithinase/hemolysin
VRTSSRAHGLARFAALFVALFVAVLVTSTAQSQTFSRVVAIGDSWTDDCCSNGPPWVEDFAEELNVPLTNLGKGGATSTDLLNQTKSYLSSQNGVADPDALYTYWNVGNDFTEPGGMNNISATVSLIESNMTAALSMLQKAGAQHFIVFNNVDGDLVPRAITQHIESIARQISDLQNSSLDSVLKNLGLTDSLVDARALFRELVADPSFKNVKQGCDNVGCSNPDVYLWWNDNHPTAEGHRRIAARALEHVSETTAAKPNPPLELTAQ